MIEEIKKEEEMIQYTQTQPYQRAGKSAWMKTGSPDLGQATSPNLGQTGSPKIEPDNGKEKKPEPPVTDFKIAEIWIRSGQLMLDASGEFWRDKFRARGVIAYLDDIVKEAKVPSDKPRIIPAKGNFLNGIRNLIMRRRK